MVSINQLVDVVCEIAGAEIKRNYILDAPLGVRGRNSDNTLIKEVLDWEPSVTLFEGMKQNYHWIKKQYVSYSFSK
jgi:nucleoside-diphosphate-sugar epimerase